MALDYETDPGWQYLRQSRDQMIAVILTFFWPIPFILYKFELSVQQSCPTEWQQKATNQNWKIN